MTRIAHKVALVLSVLFISVASALAQYGASNARSVGMAGAYMALARGVEAPTWNPANLGLRAKRVYRLNLFSFGLGIHNNSFTKKQYELYNDSFLTEQDKQDILNSIPAEGMSFDLDTEIQALGLSIGPLAFTASGYAASDFGVSRDIADLLLNGNDFGRTYRVGDTSGEGWAVSSFALSGGFPIYEKGLRRIAVGGSVKLLRGLAYGKVVEAESEFITDIDGLHGNGRLVIESATGGSGVAFDVGAAATLNSRWSVSMGISNLINSINWSNETKRFIYTFAADSVSVQKFDEMDADSVVTNSDEEIDIEPFSTSLPRQLRLGIARVTSKYTLTLDYFQGFSDNAAFAATPGVAVGGELSFIGFLPLRAGLAMGGKRGLSTSFGFGLDFSVFSWDFAVASKGGMFSGKGAQFAFDWMFRF